MAAIICTPDNVKKQIEKASLAQIMQVTYKISADDCANRVKVMTIPQPRKRQCYVKAFKAYGIEELSEKISQYMLSLEHRRIYKDLKLCPVNNEAGETIYFAEVLYFE